MPTIKDITDAVISFNPKANIDIIWKAYIYSAKVHRGQTRKSGEPFLSHPLNVALILTDLKMDELAIAAGILHDTVEDTYSTYEEIKEIFGEEIASLVEGVTKISKIHFTSSEEKQAENFRKMIIAMANDIRVILIKLADRLHNMSTLQYVPAAKQIEVATETKDIYAPIANRLGIHWLKVKLEDYILMYLYPEEYREIRTKVKKSYEERSRYIEKIRAEMRKKLKKVKIDATITGRPKHYYSIFFKMKSQNLSFDELYDLLGLRIITSSIKNCYTIFGIIHSHWKPIRGKVKDYIAMPKANMYQSLHTSVISDNGRRVEFQIRTKAMHKTAEEGIAAHWKYKEGRSHLEKDEKWFLWLKHLLKSQQDLKNPKEFLETVKTDLFPDEVYVFTPKGEVKSFPAGTTPVDFAYSIHTEIGHRCMGAKVNGKIVPLKYQLKNGESVEILTSSHHLPNKDWLKFVKTSKAKNKIRNWIKEEQKGRSISLGREILERELEKYGINLSKIAKKDISGAALELGFSNVDNLMANIGCGHLPVTQVTQKMVPKDILDVRKNRSNKIVHLDSKRGPEKNNTGITVKGVNDILIRFGKCCAPLPGDDIIGFITRGRGVSVHLKRCPSISELTAYDTERLVNVEWDSRKPIVQSVKILIYTIDTPGLLAKISSAITHCDINICSANIQTSKEKKAFFDINVEISSLDQLNMVIREIKKVKGVLSAERSSQQNTQISKRIFKV